MNRKKIVKGLKLEKSLRTALYFAFEALVDVLIIFVFVRAFSLSYHFAHDVFVDTAYQPGSSVVVQVHIDEDPSTSDVSEKIYKAGVVKSKYVLMAKIKLGEYGGKIKAGDYNLSPSMKYSEVINAICRIKKEDTEEKKNDDDDDIDLSSLNEADIKNNSSGEWGGSESDAELEEILQEQYQQGGSDDENGDE